MNSKCEWVNPSVLTRVPLEVVGPMVLCDFEWFYKLHFEDELLVEF